LCSGPTDGGGFLELFISISVLSAIFFFTYLSVSPTGFSLKENTPLPKKVLVIFLSPANGAVEQKVASLKEAKTVEELLNLVNSTQELRSWRMPLEAILHHRNRLEKVVVLASSLSAKQLDSFKKLVEVLQNLSKLKFSLQFQKVDNFFSVKEVIEALDSAFKELKSEGFSVKDLIVDLTGGPKTASVAAALFTLYSGYEFQFENNSYKVLSFEVEFVNNDGP
jgi:hypothetical protein